jgi:hypothetical protein
MSIDCTCPECRAFRGEISKEAYAWFIKGCIYTTEAILKHYNADKNGKSLSPFKWTTLAKTNLGGDYVMLEDLLKKIENPDPALLHPADYTLPKE